MIASTLVLLALGAARAAPVPAGLYRPLFVEGAADAGFAAPPPVEVPAFLLDVRQVTVDEYLAFVRKFPEWRRSKAPRVFVDKSYLASWADDLTPPPGSGAWPVTEVSWFAARAFCKARGARLPTTAEWERAAEEEGAAREALNARILAWYAEPTQATRRAAGSGPANRFGVRDLHALVWEWVLDFNEALIGGDVRDEKGNEVKLFCGGGAAKAQDPNNYAAFMRFAFRSSLNASYTVRTLGFRCARNPS